jgi:hypothetical protein
MSAYFDRDTVSLPGFAEYFRNSSLDERGHAQVSSHASARGIASRQPAAWTSEAHVQILRQRQHFTAALGGPRRWDGQRGGPLPANDIAHVPVFPAEAD